MSEVEEIALLTGYRYNGEHILLGAGDVASLAARARSSDAYRCGSLLEQAFGERRLFDVGGRTLHGCLPTIPPEFSARIIGDRYDDWGYSIENLGNLEPTLATAFHIRQIPHSR